MLIAKQTDTGFNVADHTVLLPNTSFGSIGPTVDQIRALGFYPVASWKPYDPATQKFEPCDPYLENGQVFTVQVIAKTADDLAADQAALKAQAVAARAQAYREESDPLFFKAQRNEATMADWLAKVNEIKARLPDPVPPAGVVLQPTAPTVEASTTVSGA